MYDACQGLTPPKSTISARRSGMAMCAGLALAFMMAPSQAAPMDGVPPTAQDQVTQANYRLSPFNTWAFSHMGAVTRTLQLPRAGDVTVLPEQPDPSIADFKPADENGLTLPEVFAQTHADGLVVLEGDRLRYEQYWNGLDRDTAHIWFSMTKSLVSTAFGVLVGQGRVDLTRSPADYIPELKGSGFERVSIQHVLDHSTAIDFKENYTDPESEFALHYAPALGMGYVPGAADLMPGDSDIYGVHDFLGRFIRPDPAIEPGEVFDYNSSNADVLGWLIARIAGVPLASFLREHIWAPLGAEHDAFIIADRALQAVATGGMNSTLRDAARFGRLVRDHGQIDGWQLVPASWVDQSLALDDSLRDRMRNNPKYGSAPWVAYHNMWWVLDSARGEFAAVGIHGQVIYINRSSNIVAAWFSSQPIASSVSSPNFPRKLAAIREWANRNDASMDGIGE